MKRIAALALILFAVSLSMADEPITTAPIAPSGWVTIDMREPAFAFNPQFINPEVPRAIVPMGWGLKIIMRDVPEPDSGCNATQTKKCTSACAKQGKSLAGCDVDIRWNEDGSTTRYLICSCYSPSVGPPQVAGSSLMTSEIKLRY